jgi:hypothetical protein
MINPISRTSWVIILLVTMSTACSKSDGSPNQDTNQPSTVTNQVNVNLGGKVTDNKQFPVNNAIVRTGNSVTKTDQFGNFRFSNLLVNANEATLIEVEKGGFFKEFKAIEIPVATEHYTTLRLQPLSEFKLFSSYLGASFKLTSGATIILPENGIAEKPGGRPYDGNARVDAYAINSDDESFEGNLPGNKAETDNQKEKLLNPMAVVFSEMTGASGQPLQIEKKSTATIILPIPVTKQATAPENISLWHFDEKDGRWKEEGKAIKEGNFYKGIVSHLSTWAIGNIN